MAKLDLNEVTKGQLAVFKAFSDPQDTPEQADLLVKGQAYPVTKVVKETKENEPCLYIAADNPNFDTTKKVSKQNPEKIIFTVFKDEIMGIEDAEELVLEGSVGEQAQESAPAPAAKAAPKKAAPKKAAPKKAAPKKAVVKKAAPKAATENQEQATAAAPATTPKVTKKVVAKKAAPKKAAPKKAAPAKAAPNKKVVAKKAVVKKAAPKRAGPAPAPAAPKSEIAEAYDEDKILILAEEEEDADILALVAEADNLIELAQDEIHDASLTEYKLGGVLYHVKKSGEWKEYEGGKYNRKHGWADFISDVLGMEYRKAMYLIDIYTKFNKYGIPATEAAKIGWTKSSVIAAAMTADNADGLLDAATTQTVSDLKETVREIKTTQQRTVTTKVGFKFRLSEDAGNAVREILEQAKTALGDKDDSELFEHIVTEWAAEHLDVASTQKANRRAAAKK